MNEVTAKGDIVHVSLDGEVHVAIINDFSPGELTCDLTIFTGSPYAPVQVAQGVPYCSSHTGDRTTWRFRPTHDGGAFAALAKSVNASPPVTDATGAVPPTVDPSQAEPTDSGGQVSSEPQPTLTDGDGGPALTPA